MGAAARRSASPRATKRVGEGGDAETGQMAAFDAPRGTGPYGIATTWDGQGSLLRLPAIISARSISIQTASQCWNRPCRAKAGGDI
jgi:streptogramin lyase